MTYKEMAIEEFDRNGEMKKGYVTYMCALHKLVRDGNWRVTDDDLAVIRPWLSDKDFLDGVLEGLQGTAYPSHNTELMRMFTGGDLNVEAVWQVRKLFEKEIASMAADVYRRVCQRGDEIKERGVC